eukprot:Lithocolla_globosa_v1_NODE_557_length_3753_cov_135.321796.p4 type:complete len:148 gc:universal NODE_557_length_3753_cov_135.321796:2757-2314(-)
MIESFLFFFSHDINKTHSVGNNDHSNQSIHQSIIQQQQNPNGPSSNCLLQGKSLFPCRVGIGNKPEKILVVDFTDVRGNNGGVRVVNGERLRLQDDIGPRRNTNSEGFVQILDLGLLGGCRDGADGGLDRVLFKGQGVIFTRRQNSH